MSPDNVSITDVHMTVAARAENVAVVRQVVAALTETLDLPRPMCEDVRIAVTEACGNVVRHAYAGGHGPMSVSLRDGDGELRVEVLDRGVGIGFDAPEGLGLPLIAALADAVRIDEGPDAGSRVAMSFAHRPVAP